MVFRLAGCANDVKRVEVQDDECEDGDTLLSVYLVKDTRYSFLALCKRKNRDEGVRRWRAGDVICLAGYN